MPISVDLTGGASKTITGAAPAVAAVNVPDGGAMLWALELTYEGTAGDGGGTDTMIPVLQTSYDGGTTWQDLASTASINGGVVAAVTEFLEALTPKAAARLAASDVAISASSINSTAIGPKARIKGKVVDADSDASWTLSRALLHVYDR